MYVDTIGIMTSSVGDVKGEVEECSVNNLMNGRFSDFSAACTLMDEN